MCLPHLRPLCLALAALSSALLPGCSEERVEPLGKPPVVLILLDALAASHVHHLGYERETTPVLDALASEGVSFSQAFAPAPYTRASIPSLMTGRLPDHHGLTTKKAVLPADEQTLAELLGEAGWWSVGAVANLNGSKLFGLDQGFEEFHELFQLRPGEDPEHVDFSGREMREPSADDFVEQTRDFLARRPTDRPPFLYLHVLEPHSPYQPPEPHRSLWIDPDYTGPFQGGETAPLVGSTRGEDHEAHVQVSAADIEGARNLYDANLHWADAAVGEILDLLRTEGLYEEALIVVTSDHGEAFWEHGRWGHNEHLYDEMLRVPLVVKLPAGRDVSVGTSDALVSIMDLVPSLCEWLDLGVPEHALDGHSLAGFIEGSRPELPGGAERRLRLRSNHSIPTVGERSATAKTIVLRDPKSGVTTGIEYYELDQDPLEREDRYLEHSNRIGARAAELERWIVDAAVHLTERGVPLSDRQDQFLEALGYGGE